MQSPTFEEIRDMQAGRLSSESLAHSERVAETAAEIAEIYGVDPEKARMSGLVHDWSREASAQELMDSAERHGIPVTELDREVPYLLHAKVGAAELRDLFGGLPEEVVRAVATHTCGSGEMHPLEKVVYVADMVEPSRDYPGAAELREAVGAVALDELFRQAYTRSVIHLIEKRRHIHPDTVAVWNAHVAESRG